MTTPHVHALDDLVDAPLAASPLPTKLIFDGGPRGHADADAFADAMQRVGRAPHGEFTSNVSLTALEANKETVSPEFTKSLAKADFGNLPGAHSPIVGSALSQEPQLSPSPYQIASDQSIAINTVEAEQSGLGTGSTGDQVPFEQVLEARGPFALGERSPSSAINVSNVAITSDDTIISALEQAGNKIVVANFQDAQSPIAGFAERQIAQRDQMLARVSSDPLQINPVALKQLQLRMGSLEEQQQLLNKLTGVSVAKSTPQALSFAPGTEVSLTKPFSTFFGFITNGERQLFSIERELAAFGGPGASTLSPVDMLRIQVKMSHVSQQLELFTSMLNKGLESSKTVLNTQI